MMTFSKTEVEQFQHRNKALRWGQAFYNHMKLDKIKGPEMNWCNRLYAASDKIAQAMVRQRTDMTQ